jgi:PAS domain S-box-containing protein
MNLTDIKIGTQLKIGFAALFVFVVLLGVVSYFQTRMVHKQTGEMYYHPFQVQRAIGVLRSDVLSIHRDMKDLILASNEKELSQNLNRIKARETDAFNQIDILYKSYLGSRSDIDSVKYDFIVWNSMREETIRLIREKRIDEATTRTKSYGVAGIKVEKLLNEIDIIDNFSQDKATEFFENSEKMSKTLNFQLALLVTIILILSLMINYFLYRNIRKPLVDLTDATKRFHEGDMSARSNYTSGNEFGILSNSFNQLVSNIESNMGLSEKVAELSAIMLSEDNPQEFFLSFLQTLSTHAGSQMAAIYLLSDDKNTFEYTSSVGLGDGVRQSFSAQDAEGEFGAAIVSCKVQYIKNIPNDSRFVFNTISGNFIPREIITIPVCDGKGAIAIISLATIGNFNHSTFQLIDKILVALSARLEGIIAFQKVKEVSEKLEQQSVELEKAVNYNRGLIDASIDSLVTIAPNGIITDVNYATEAFLGRTRDELIGTDVTTYFTEPHRAKAGYEMVFKLEIVRDYELVMVNVDGKEIPVIYNASVYRDEKGEVIGILAAARDITDRKLAEKEQIRLNQELSQRSHELEQQNVELESQKSELSSQSSELMMQNTELEMQKKQLGEANRLKTIFLSNMSHELRTPLNSVIALSGVLSRRLTNKIPEEEHSYLEVIERNGKHLLDLINDILDISRIEAGKEDVEITRFNINNTISDVASMIMPQAKGKNIQLIHNQPDNEIAITSDAGKIRHILQNLIGNAVKFTEQGSVQVFAEERDGKIVIKVIDSGIGISEKNQKHIFDEFRQADGGTARKFGGTGLGLAIAKKYVNFLGGKISVNSSPGQGSEFTVSLPLFYSAEIVPENKFAPFDEPIQQSALSIPKSVNGIPTILLVEDSEPAIIQIKDIFDEDKFKIIVARNGQQALDMINHTIPDAIILDLMMPGVDGFDVLKSVREAEITAHVPVLILTAKHISKDELKFLRRNNIHQLIQKGNVNRDELLKAVASMVCQKAEEPIKQGRELPKIDRKPLVLVIEDNLDNMLTVKAILAEKFTMIEAVDGKSGVEMAKLHKPDLILMDIQLPEMDGIEAFKAIRAEGRLQHIPIVALTASAMTAERETILAHGFDAYIAKPIDEKNFFKTINEILYGE